MIVKTLNAFRDAAHDLTEALATQIGEIGQAESARMAGLAASDVSAWIAGKRRWTLEKQAAVLAAITPEEKIF